MADTTKPRRVVRVANGSMLRAGLASPAAARDDREYAATADDSAPIGQWYTRQVRGNKSTLAAACEAVRVFGSRV
jgi:hypothetical protein